MDEWFAEWFDADYAALYAHRDETEAALAIQTALAVAPALATGPVLDLGCGAGRHLTALRRVNQEAFGLDLSADLLAQAPPDLRPWLVRADMRRLPLREGTLAGITLWFTPFGYFSDGENRALLGRLSACLRPGGVLVLDFLNAGRLPRTLVAEDTQERNGLRVHSRRSLENGRVVKRMTLTRLNSGARREVVESVRLYAPEELRTMAAHEGLSPLAELGAYDGAPFCGAESPRWIGIFQRPPAF